MEISSNQSIGVIQMNIWLFIAILFILCLIIVTQHLIYRMKQQIALLTQTSERSFPEIRNRFRKIESIDDNSKSISKVDDE